MACIEPPMLRMARADDAPALRAILYDTFESTWKPELTPEAVKAFLREDRPGAYVSTRGQLFWVAERDREIAGFVDWDGDFVNALHVLARHARTGVGARLMDLAEAEIANAGFAAARLETDTFNLRSQAFYRARGYVDVERYPDLEWNSGLTTLLLQKALTGH